MEKAAFNFTDFDPNYGATLEEILYYLHIRPKFRTREAAVREMNNLAKRMNNARKRYPTVSFYIGASCVKGKSASRTYVHTGKRGRPRCVINGATTAHHLHVVVYGKGSAAFCNFVRDKLNKQHNCQYASTQCISNRSAHAIRYVVRQSYASRHGGDFDFEDYSYMFKQERPQCKPTAPLLA